MSTTLIVAVVSGIVALLSATVTMWGTLFNNSRTIRFEADKQLARVESEVNRYQEPLATAIYELQNRLYNIVHKVFVQRFITDGSAREREYAIENTAFVIAQYFCCVELLRRSVQGSGFGQHLVNHKARTQQDRISLAFVGSDECGSILRLFDGEQRAIGEALIQDSLTGPECMGYRMFLKSRPRGEEKILDYLRDGIEELPGAPDDCLRRLGEIHAMLLDWLLQIDPDYRRFSKESRRPCHLVGDA